MIASWSPMLDVIAVVVLGAILTGSIVWFGCRTRRRARTRPGSIYQRRNLDTGAVTWRAVDGAGRRSRKFRSQHAAGRWLARRQGRSQLHLVDRDRYRLECRHVAKVDGPCGPTSGRAWCEACGESRAVLP